MKILIVEDDVKIANFLKQGLEEENFFVDLCHDGEDGEYVAEVNSYDLIILDLMLPFKSGEEICKSLREKDIETPIIMLTAKDTIADKVDGLTLGANDYVTKPFSFEELLARVRVQLRSRAVKNSKLVYKDLTLNIESKEVYRGERKIKLTPKEYSVLEYLMRNPNVVLSERMILDNVSHMEDETMSNVLNVYIYRLRKKIDKESDVKLIHTLRGVGYKLCKEEM